jgi:hypothetical protein
MNETTFTILNYNQTVTTRPSEISGDHDALNFYLNVPVNFNLRTLNDDHGFDLLPVNARLSFQGPLQLLSEVAGLRGISVHGRESQSGYILKFILNDRVVDFIEKNRKEDLNMLLELNLNAYIKTSMQNVTGRRSFSTDYIHSETVRLDFQIPKSTWVEKILPKLGFRNFKLIEIPLSHDMLKESYDDIILEFNKAEHYYKLHDYNKCIAHCRHTLDALTRNLVKIKNRMPSETGFEWLKTVSQETFSWIDKLNQKTSALASKTHHSGQKIDFNRQEAESIYLIVVGLLNYIGSLKA